jgi:hypothetical protein
LPERLIPVLSDLSADVTDHNTSTRRNDMTTMPIHDVQVTGGVDTHRDSHMVAALDQRGAPMALVSPGSCTATTSW